MTHDPKDLFRILYRSRCALQGSDAAIETGIERILAQSQIANAKAGLTGALMFTASTFVQALEGPALALETTFERICCDRRHSDVQLLEFSRVEERAFSDWSMGRVHADGGVTSLLTTLHPSDGNDEALTEAASQAVELMKTLIRVESLRGQKAAAEAAA